MYTSLGVSYLPGTISETGYSTPFVPGSAQQLPPVVVTASPSFPWVWVAVAVLAYLLATGKSRGRKDW